MVLPAGSWLSSIDQRRNCRQSNAVTLFAGSMGGGIISWEDALANNRKHIFSLPDDTVLCPGHGPLTSVREEKRNNPFYPEFKK